MAGIQKAPTPARRPPIILSAGFGVTLRKKKRVSGLASQRGDERIPAWLLSHPWRKNKYAPRMGHPALFHTQEFCAFVFWSQNRDLYPTDEELSVGTLELGARDSELLEYRKSKNKQKESEAQAPLSHFC
jgi:hypothetical protein